MQNMMDCLDSQFVMFFLNANYGYLGRFCFVWDSAFNMTKLWTRGTFELG